MKYEPTNITKSQYNSGIYKIQSINGNLYIGSSVSIKSRYLTHRNSLQKGLHDNKIMQNIFNKYGEDCFTFSTIELCDVSLLIEREQHYIDTLKPDINICKVAGATYGNKPFEGRRHSDDSKKKISESNIKTKSLNRKPKKQVLSKEDRMQRFVDYSKSYENRKRVSQLHTGNKYWLGKKHNQSTIDARTGALNPNSKSVFCKELGITFNTGIEASIFFNKSRALISKCINKGATIKHNDIICTLK